ncbi:BTAD domain-containing putative transcriptional regulator [Amycolatopsis sp. NPDC051045]|uniref:AfsR/SARP family transcriptional regulator n=1 Tax=Amycolatopsis sp. NPDC051045 TaxID=3156922 RepID=UPI00343DFA37
MEWPGHPPRTAVSGVLRLRVLGEVAASAGDDRLDLGHARQRCVLAVLLVEANLVVTTEQLRDRVWGDRPPLRARQVVTNYVSRLRRVLAAAGGGVEIHRRGGGYVLLTEPDRVDLHCFRRLVRRARDETDDRRALRLLEEASALWSAEAFADLDVPWIEAVREGLAMERFAADADRIDLALRLGRHAALLPELTARAAAHPLDERVAAQLVLARYRAGSPAEALAEYGRVRARLADELGIDPGPALRNLHRRVLAADPELDGPARPSSAAAPVPRQLPAPPGWFTGRVAALARLTDFLAGPGASPIAVVSGPGGIGKTWLALEWAHRNAGRFPDGQLFVDLRGFSADRDGPMAPGVAVRGFLAALGVDPDLLPAEPHARTALFRSLTTGRRLLLVLDNAADAEQVRELLPGGGSCAVLVTSRRRLAGLTTAHGAGQLPLDVLAGDESRALLARRLGGRVTTEAAAVTELVASCGGFPMALGIVATRAQTHPEVPLAELVADLRSLGLAALADDDPAASLPAVLSWSYRALPADRREVFRLLGAAPGADLGVPAAAALTGRPPAQVRVVLRSLEEASLLIQHPPGRFRMRELIRSYAGVAGGGPDPAALDRLTDFYLRTAYTAERLLNPYAAPIRLGPAVAAAQPLSDAAAALAWLETEHTNLLAVQRAAAEAGKNAVVWQLAWVVLTFQTRRGYHREQAEVWRAALEAAPGLPDPAARTVAHRRLGAACVELGRHEEAVEHLHRALELARWQHDVGDEAHTHYQLAWAWGRRGADRPALDHAIRAVRLCRAASLPVWEADALNAAGWHAARLGDYDAARRHCGAALSVHRKYHNAHGQANALRSLGEISRLTGHEKQAVRRFRMALALYRDYGVTAAEADVADRLGRARTAPAAQAGWQEAFRQFRPYGGTTA